MAPRLALALLTGILVTGCDDGDGDASPIGGDVELPAAGELFLEVSGELFVTTDGAVYRAVDGPMGMVPQPTGGTTWEVAELTADGLDLVVDLLAEHDFFDPPPDYSQIMVTDVDPNRVIVTTAGSIFEHEAYVDHVNERDGGAAYARLRAVLGGLRDLTGLVDGEITAFEPYLPESWEVVDRIGGGGIDVIDGEVEPWPFTAPATEGCTTFPDDQVAGDGVDHATGRYRSGRRVLDVEPRFPWDGPC